MQSEKLKKNSKRCLLGIAHLCGRLPPRVYFQRKRIVVSGVSLLVSRHGKNRELIQESSPRSAILVGTDIQKHADLASGESILDRLLMTSPILFTTRMRQS